MKKRVFVALEISELARRRALHYIEYLRTEFQGFRVSWEKPEKLHLTMKFLGELDDRHLTKLSEAVEQSARKTAPFKLQISSPGVFPSPKKARVLWLGIKDELGSLRSLNGILEDECEKQGFQKEQRIFTAHLTIGRCQERFINQFLIEKHLNTDSPPSEPFEVAEIVIFESRLQPTGSIYFVHSRHRFKKET
jgi:2'-5' RNA ligase